MHHEVYKSYAIICTIQCSDFDLCFQQTAANNQMQRTLRSNGQLKEGAICSNKAYLEDSTGHTAQR